MERQDYPAMLPQLQPAQAVDILNDRVRQVGSLNNAIATWLQERRKLEEQYSAGLRKLARKQIDDSELGIFSVPWATLTGSADTLADSHAALATKMEVDVEQPLRSFASTNREMQAMSTIQGNLASMARDVERAQQKTDKLKGKGDSSRVAHADQELDQAQSQWESQAPYIFENLQAVDETRLNHLRDVLTQFQTHEVDMVQKNQSTAEHCLNVLLSLQTEDEIKTFALKAVSGRPRIDRTQRPSTSTPSRAAPPSSSTLSPTISQADDVSQRSGSVQEEKKKSRLGGLKRLGTVMGGGRKRESKLPSQLQPMAESPEPRSKPSGFNSFSGRLGRSKDTPNLEPTPEATSPRLSQRPRSPLRLGSEMLEPSSDSGFQPPSPRPVQRAGGAPHINGSTIAAGSAAAAAGGALVAANIPNGSHQSDLADLQPPSPAPVQSQAQQPTAEPVRDHEGYSLPPQNIDPITQAQQDAAAAGERAEPAYNVNIRDAPIRDDGADPDAALASVATKLQAPPLVQSRVGTVRGRRQGRPVSSVPGTYAPPLEQPPPRSVSEQIPETSPITAPATNAAVPTVESSRDVVQPPAAASPIQPPNTNFAAAAASPLVQSPSGGSGFGAVAASTFSPFPSAQGQPMPFRQDSRTAVGADAAGDAQSIRSGRSLTSTGSQGLRHPDLTESGLNSSVVETINAKFENGQITSSSLIGEIALAYNPADFSSPFGTENIRLENFAMLEKVAPNPTFITQTSNREGEYSVNLAHITKTQVAFKYQLKLDEAGSQAPLLIAPAFRIEPTQASIIVSYSLNPAFNAHGRESITLSNVTLALTLEGAKATSCQSKPVGTFSRERNMIVWQIGEITVKAGAAPEKLLARFATESEAKTGTVETRWEISGEHAQTLGSGLAVSVQGQHTGATDAADPFADESAAGLTGVWKGVQGVKKLTSGAYTAK